MIQIIKINKNYPVPEGYKTVKIEGNIRYLEALK